MLALLPERVDPRHLARVEETLQGRIPFARFARLAEYVMPAEDDVVVELAFRHGRKRRLMALGRAAIQVRFECQGCLGEVVRDIDVSIRTLLLDNEGRRSDVGDDEDMLVLDGRMLRLADLLEDDLILALPMVPRCGREGCVRELGYQSGQPDDKARRQHPFAGLKSLLGSGHPAATDD